MMTEYQIKQQTEAQALTELTAAIAKELGAPWKVRAPRPDRDEQNYPARWIVNGDGAELWVKIESYGAGKGRVNISGSMHVGPHGQYEQVYENGNRVSVPDITVNPARGVAVIAKEIKRRLLPEYLRVLALAVAQVKRHTDRTAARHQVMRELAAISGANMPDLALNPDSGRLHIKQGSLEVHYDLEISFERLRVTREQAAHILRYLKGETPLDGVDPWTIAVDDFRKDQRHTHECPQCKGAYTCNNPKNCPGIGKQALCGSCPE